MTSLCVFMFRYLPYCWVFVQQMQAGGVCQSLGGKFLQNEHCGGLLLHQALRKTPPLIFLSVLCGDCFYEFVSYVRVITTCVDVVIVFKKDKCILYHLTL